MGVTTSKEQFIEILNSIRNNGDISGYKNEIIEALEFAIENYDMQSSAAYVAALEAKVYTYEMIIAKSNFRSMLETTDKPNSKPNNKPNNDAQKPQNSRNNQRGNHTSLGQRTQNRTQYRSQNGTFKSVKGGLDKGANE